MKGRNAKSGTGRGEEAVVDGLKRGGTLSRQLEEGEEPIVECSKRGGTYSRRAI
jgi:hypothetical protein